MYFRASPNRLSKSTITNRLHSNSKSIGIMGKDRNHIRDIKVSPTNTRKTQLY